MRVAVLAIAEALVEQGHLDAKEISRIVREIPEFRGRTHPAAARLIELSPAMTLDAALPGFPHGGAISMTHVTSASLADRN